MIKFIIIFSSIFFTVNASASEAKAPFGFHWGENIQQIKSKNIILSKCKRDKSLTTCRTSKAIRNLSFAEIYVLIFDSQLGLQKVMMLSKDITDDATGNQGKKLYSKVKDSLIKKYGEPNEKFSSESSGLELYKDYDEFYQCLAYSGCGMWISAWTPRGGGTIILELKGVNRGKGFLEIDYESKNWSDIIEKRNEKQNKIDSDAL